MIGKAISFKHEAGGRLRDEPKERLRLKCSDSMTKELSTICKETQLRYFKCITQNLSDICIHLPSTLSRSKTSSNHRLESAGLNALEDLLFKMLGMVGEDQGRGRTLHDAWHIFCVMIIQRKVTSHPVKRRRERKKFFWMQ